MMNTSFDAFEAQQLQPDFPLGMAWVETVSQALSGCAAGVSGGTVSVSDHKVRTTSGLYGNLSECDS